MIYSEKWESSHSFNFVCSELREKGASGRKASVLCLADSNNMKCTKKWTANPRMNSCKSRHQLDTGDGVVVRNYKNIWRQITGMRQKSLGESLRSFNTESVGSTTGITNVATLKSHINSALLSLVGLRCHLHFNSFSFFFSSTLCRTIPGVWSFWKINRITPTSVEADSLEGI